jgi:hypothetical protein
LAGVLVLGLTLMSDLAKDKNQVRDWETGKLVSIEQGIPDRSPGIVVQPSPYSVPAVLSATYKSWIYTVETEAMIYGFCERYHEHPRPFTVGNRVKFAFGQRAMRF